MHSELEKAMRCRVFPITKRIGIGQFATPARAYDLLEEGYTHVLNVSEASSVIVASPEGFQQVVDHRIADLVRMPNETATRCLDIVHEMLQVGSGRVYLHCIACQNRSPTILWLYLVSVGMSKDNAKSLIVKRCPDAVPGHNTLVDDSLVQLVQEHGRKHLLPLHDSAIVEPAY